MNGHISKYFIALLLVIGLLLSGCSTLLSFSPERAAAQEVLSNPMSSIIVDPNSVQVLQTQEFGEAVIVLVSFQGDRPGVQRDQCLFVYETRRARLGWVTGGGGGGCGPAGEGTEPVEVGSGSNMHSGPGQNSSFSHFNGRVNDPEIVAVEVTWDDGEKQRAEVINGTILGVRAGQSELDLLEGLDAGDQVIYTYTQPEIPEGKR